MSNIIYDSHCHIFTLDYGIREIKNIVKDYKRGIYHLPAFDGEQNSSDNEGNKLNINNLFYQIIELLSASLGSEEENLNFIQKEATNVWGSENKIKIIPLMMDIYYLLYHPLDINQDTPIELADSQTNKSFNEDKFDAEWELFVSSLKKNTFLWNKIKRIKINNFFNNILAITKSKKQLKDDFEFFKTDGFCFHLNNLINLEKKRKGELYPFIAVDPRRDKIIDDIIGGRLITKDGPFYGVKLYPRMGYHPLCLPMDRLFEYCSKNDIPIITHCGKSGFPPSTKWHYTNYGSPFNFEPVLKKYNNLRIDFAHLGNSDNTYEWAKKIVEFINNPNYPNVYSDLSCYTSKDELNNIKDFWKNNVNLQQKLMLGSDFDVMYFTDKVTMKVYLQNFKDVFTKEELQLLYHDNINRFLKINN